MLVPVKWLLCKSIPILCVLGATLSIICPSWGQKRQFQFEQFPAKVYEGPFKIPDGLRKDEQGEWLDELDHSVAPPKVGFAGEYYLPVQSCGTGCRYYLLLNLRTGARIPEIYMFNAGDPLPKTKDGHPYLTMLYYRPDSRLLIAEYHLDFDDPNKKETCRQRYFVLENGKLRPISKTFPFCTEERER
jgi:hypothetical protein